MRKFCQNLFFLVIILICGNNPVYGQTSYSEPFVDGTDSWNKHCLITHENLCKTTFIRETVVNLLDTHNIDHIKVGLIKVHDKEYFTLSAMKNATETINTIIGNYPCPQDCVPPEMKLDSMRSVLMKIDTADINAILDYKADVDYITVRLGQKKTSGTTSLKPAIIIYGAKGSYRPNVSYSVTDLDKPGHPRFISSQ